VGRPRIAILHDWLVGLGGGERCLIRFHRLFPDAPIFTLLSDRSRIPSDLSDADIRVSRLQRVPGALGNYQKLMALYPWAARSLDTHTYDVILSSCHSLIKAVPKRAVQVHVCYCYTPTRYLWDLYETYLEHGGLGATGRAAFAASVRYLRPIDLAAAERVDHFIAISKTVQERIKRIYRRDSDVVYPPVDTDFFTPGGSREDFFLAAGRLVAYKRFDVISEAATRANISLVVVGDGPLRKALSGKAGPTVEFVGAKSDAELRDYYRRARALVFAAEEDFGIVPLEAMACGTPVIAYGKGGATETVVEGDTGLFFTEQTPESLAEVLRRFRGSEFSVEAVRKRAETFSVARFDSEFASYFSRCLSRQV
jgi:glycosyltransferase involved in cell wall biosynthesis